MRAFPVLAALAVLAATPAAMAAICLDCIVAPPSCVNSQYGRVCATWVNDCIFASGQLYAKSYVVSQTVYGTSYTTKPVNAGPVHVSSVTVSTDTVTVGPYYVNTPGRTVSNEFCTSEYLALA